MKNDVIVADFTETLLEVCIDNLDFKITWNPVERESCILWFRDGFVGPSFEALGKFTRFERRQVLDFIVRYATSSDLRTEIEMRRFTRKVDTLTPDHFEVIELLSPEKKQEAYRQLFDLDADIERTEIDKKKRIMAKRFHPDTGGDHRAMTVINDAHENLSKLANR